MRQIVLAALALIGGACALGQAFPANAQAAEGVEYVVVQFDQPRILRHRADGHLPSLEELGFQRLTVPPGTSAAEFAETLRHAPDVLSAAPDVRVEAAATPNDPFFTANQATYMGLIRAPAAWDIATGNGEPTIVAVLDSGLDVRHPELAPRLWENTRDASSDGIDDDGNKCPDDRYGCRFVQLTDENRDLCGYSSSLPSGAVLDDNGKPGSTIHSHGTLVGGIIGAAGNNSAGITGMAWNVRLMTVKVLDCGSGTGGAPSGSMFDVARGIDYARLNGARVVNLSLAGNAASDTAEMRAAIAAAEAEGVIIVAAAGNHRPGQAVGPGYPAAYTQFSNIIAVAASDSSGHWATFSNYGPAIDIAAPGVGIAGTWRTDLGHSQPYGADTNGGTSFATPLVSGVLALMISRNPFLEADEYITALKASATPAPAASHGQNWAGSGILDAGRAVARVPMSLSGAPLKDFMDVPAGTEVRAIIDGQECGRTTTTTFGPIARYSLRVKSNAELPGCGQPGSQVQFLIDGLTVPDPVIWGTRDEVIGLRNKDLSSVSPPPGPLVIQVTNGTWSNLAQLDSSGPLPAALAALSSAWGAVLRWDPTGEGYFGGRYRRFIKDVPDYVNDIGTLERYDAFWIDAAAGRPAVTNPGPQPGRTISLKAGWNNFVYTGHSRAVADALSGVAGKYTQVLRFDNASSTWLSHVPTLDRYLNDFGGLFQLQVYWVLMTEDAELTMR
jgi:subtilisin family serine protease